MGFVPLYVVHGQADTYACFDTALFDGMWLLAVLRYSRWSGIPGHPEHNFGEVNPLTDDLSLRRFVLLFKLANHSAPEGQVWRVLPGLTRLSLVEPTVALVTSSPIILQSLNYVTRTIYSIF